MKFELDWRIKVIFDTQTFDSWFTKREFVVTTPGEYPQDIKFELIKDKVEILNSFSDGEDVKVSFNIRWNEYNGKYFVSLPAWKVEKSNWESSSNESYNAPSNKQESDDLPF